MKEKLTIVKVGGAVVEDELQLSQLLKDFSAIEGRKVLVHGGGRKATKMAERLGIETQMVNGRRITDSEMLEVVTMVYGGLVNKNLVAQLQANGINALGLTGADANAIRSHKRPLKDGVDYGWVGDVYSVANTTLGHLIEAGIITGSGFDVNPKSLGYSTCTYVGINLEKGSMYKDVVEELQHIPEVVECHFTTGPYTMLVKLYARDNEQLMQLLNGRLQDIHGVVATETLISLEQSIKREIPVHVEEK